MPVGECDTVTETSIGRSSEDEERYHIMTRGHFTLMFTNFYTTLLNFYFAMFNNNPSKLVYAIGFVSYLIVILHFRTISTKLEGIKLRKYNVVEAPSISWSPQ